jgi:hypothetical protein
VCLEFKNNLTQKKKSDCCFAGFDRFFLFRQR